VTGPLPNWWETAVFYQIYPRSFCDRSGDGVGDLAGIIAHLDHIVDLGVDAIWLSPIFPSPMADFGYDVADYCGVDPLFGSIEAFDRLIAEAHRAGLRVILDWVPNHTSSEHPWFIDARSSPDSARRDWYIWRKGSGGNPPTNWRAAFTGVGRHQFPPAWTRDPATDDWYLHLFLAEQPDLNWSNPAVQDAMGDTLRFWLARGVDGFRMDVIHALGKDPALPDLPDDLAAIPMCALIHDPSVHPLVEGIRAVVKGCRPDAVLVGETVLPTVGEVADFYGTPGHPELDLAFNFHPLHARWDADAWKRQIEAVETEIGPRGWPAWALGNHDNPRQRTRYGSAARARAAAVLLLTLRGTPFLYAGEELGLEDAVVGPDRQVDPGGRDGCRAPIPWNADAGHGWSGPPWLPWPPDTAAGIDAASQAGSPDSTLNLYRRVLAARRRSPALTSGELALLPSPEGVIAWRRWTEQDERVVVINFSESEATQELAPGEWVVEVGTEGEGLAASGTIRIRASEAVVLAPVNR
jgi:alpha-glucosidase